MPRKQTWGGGLLTEVDVALAPAVPVGIVDLLVLAEDRELVPQALERFQRRTQFVVATFADGKPAPMPC